MFYNGFEEQIEVVNKTLLEIKSNDKPIVLVFNKIDKLSVNEARDAEEDFYEFEYKNEKIKINADLEKDMQSLI